MHLVIMYSIFDLQLLDVWSVNGLNLDDVKNKIMNCFSMINDTLEDTLIWMGNLNGECSAKDGFNWIIQKKDMY